MFETKRVEVLCKKYNNNNSSERTMCLHVGARGIERGISRQPNLAWILRSEANYYYINFKSSSNWIPTKKTSVFLLHLTLT